MAAIGLMAGQAAWRQGGGGEGLAPQKLRSEVAETNANRALSKRDG
jgi:hypothetical protein